MAKVIIESRLQRIERIQMPPKNGKPFVVVIGPGLNLVEEEVYQEMKKTTSVKARLDQRFYFCMTKPPEDLVKEATENSLALEKKHNAPTETRREMI